MPKAHGKSSATSATRKKHQKKAAVALGIDLESSSSSAKQQPGKPKNKEKSARGKKDGKKEPRVKAYIPPVKPTRARPDPLDVDGLARRLPPELVVVLRNVGKKAQMTKMKALEELESAWVEKAVNPGMGGESGDMNVNIVESLAEMIPAWVRFAFPLPFPV